ncbi:MAG: transposase [Rhizonema sp. PD38]|nr:transposase [Rhizonema sp. PD38]
MNFRQNHRNRKRKHKVNLGKVPVAARWVIERSNAWMERCKILVKNFERTLANATAKVNLCFIRLMVKRLATSC